MSAIIADIVIYGVPAAIGLGALGLIGRYYGRKAPPKPDETPPPKDDK